MAGVAIAILAFGLLRTLIGAWYQGVEASRRPPGSITRNAISLVFPLPLSYLERIRQVPGVKTVSYGNWFGGVYIDRKNFFPNFAVDADTYLGLYPEFVPVPGAEGRLPARPERGGGRAASWRASTAGRSVTGLLSRGRSSRATGTLSCGGSTTGRGASTDREPVLFPLGLPERDDEEERSPARRPGRVFHHRGQEPGPGGGGFGGGGPDLSKTPWPRPSPRRRRPSRWASSP